MILSKFANKNNRFSFILVIVLLCFNAALVFMPNPFDKKQAYTYTEAEVLETDNSELFQYNIIKQGSQLLTVKILSGEYEGKEFEVFNQLVGKMETDKYIRAGDRVLVEYFKTGEGKVIVNVVDHYRFGIELFLFLAFAAILILYSGWTGLKSLLSFTTSLLVIWKIMIPMFLQGHNPLYVSFFLVLFLTMVIIFLVGGFTRKGIIAFLGASSGVLVTMTISLLVSKPFYINGAVRSFSETLLYSGFAHLDLNKLFLASIFIGSSGAVMDISMDISASMCEVLDKHPKITRKELMKSGFNVGKAVIGTMATTLLLAYSGSFLILLMVFMAQGTNPFAMLNINYIASEILNTLVGSLGLVLTAPFTAIIGSVIYKSSRIRVPSGAESGNTVIENKS